MSHDREARIIDTIESGICTLKLCGFKVSPLITNLGMLKSAFDSDTLSEDYPEKVGVEGGRRLFIVSMNFDQIIDLIIEVGGLRGPVHGIRPGSFSHSNL